MTLTKDKYDELKKILTSVDDDSDFIDIYNVLIDILKERKILV